MTNQFKITTCKRTGLFTVWGNSYRNTGLIPVRKSWNILRYFSSISDCHDYINSKK